MKSAATTTVGITRIDAERLYREGNNAGAGWGLSGIMTLNGEDPSVDVVSEWLVSNGAILVHPRVTRNDLAVLNVHGDLVAIGGDGNADNAWCVTIRKGGA